MNISKSTRSSSTRLPPTKAAGSEPIQPISACLRPLRRWLLRFRSYPLIAPVSAIFVIALTWLATVLYFRRLAQAKFAVITEIEKTLVLPAFKLEWQHFKGQRSFFQLGLTHLEMVIPAGVAACGAAYILYWIGCRIHSLVQ